ncbi:MAG: WG repeat-containing protein [Clostridia bacterium]|nr:WG repeat-containing protein [Clostridia bacterium]
MDRIRGKRFDDEPKLNMKKVFATIVAIIVFIMVIISIKNLFNKKNKVSEMPIQTAYFTIYQDGKYGVIDSKGNIVIKPTYEEMIIIPNPSRALFICTYDVNYGTGDYKTKVLNDKGNTILENYSNIQAIENSNATDIWYEDHILKYEKDGLYGLIDFNGNKIGECEYTNIYALEGIQKSIVIEKNGLKGIVNSSLSQIVINPEYVDITTLANENADSGYIVNKDSKVGLVSGTGKIILECNYSEIKHVSSNNMYVVNDGTGLKIIDNLLNVVKEDGFDDVKSIDGENIIIEQNGKYGVISTNSEEKIPVQYEDLKFACDTYYIAKRGDLYGIVSLDNVVCLDFKYNSINFLKTTNFYEAENSNYTTDIISRDLEVKLSSVIISELNTEKSYMRIRIDGEYKYYNFNFEEKTNKDVLKSNTLFLDKKDGKYGYVNKDGNLIVNYIYDDAKEQNQYGYCAVKKDGLWGVLSQNGSVILKPSVNLDDSLYVEFISSWHLYKDTDLDIYVK